MTVKPLLIGQPVTAKGDMPSAELVLIIQQLVREVNRLSPLYETIHGTGGVLERLDNLESP